MGPSADFCDFGVVMEIWKDRCAVVWDDGTGWEGVVRRGRAPGIFMSSVLGGHHEAGILLWQCVIKLIASRGGGQHPTSAYGA